MTWTSALPEDMALLVAQARQQAAAAAARAEEAMAAAFADGPEVFYVRGDSPEMDGIEETGEDDEADLD